MKNVLLIEDDELVVRTWKTIFGGSSLYVIAADNPEDAKKVFDDGPSDGKWDVIVVDGCLQSGYTPNTIPLIKHIKRTFKGPLVAIASADTVRKEQILAGCTHEVPEKYRLPEFLRGILKAMDLAQSRMAQAV
jgi:CheY-like chemotaxis protein